MKSLFCMERSEAALVAPVDKYIIVCNGHVLNSYADKTLAMIDYKFALAGGASVALMRIEKVKLIG